MSKLSRLLVKCDSISFIHDSTPAVLISCAAQVHGPCMSCVSSAHERFNTFCVVLTNTGAILKKPCKGSNHYYRQLLYNALIFQPLSLWQSWQ
jgi:hypothetical protein